MRSTSATPTRPGAHVFTDLYESATPSVRGQAPKSSAGRRFVHLDRIMMTELKEHLAEHAAPDPDAYLFTGENPYLARP
jgi:hypothetical protein